MDEFNKLREVLVGRAKAVAAALDVPLELPNTPFPEATTGVPYISFWFELGDTDLAEMGGPKALEITVGVLQFDVLVPEGSGDGRAMAIANQIKKRINRKQWLVPPDGYVSLDVAQVRRDLPNEKRGFFRTCCDATFLFYHRDPDASALQQFV